MPHRTKLLYYGLQRSGTNYLEVLLKKNFSVRLLNRNRDRGSPLNKHCRFYDDKQIIPEPRYYNDISVHSYREFQDLFKSDPDYYVVISKDPYSWYLSYRSWAQRCNWPSTKHHYIEEYNLFYGKFLELSSESDKFVFVRYVDLLGDKTEVNAMLANMLCLKPKTLARFRPRRPSRVSQSLSFSAERATYYVDQKYLEEYTPDELADVEKHLNSEVAKALGY